MRWWVWAVLALWAACNIGIVVLGGFHARARGRR